MLRKYLLATAAIVALSISSIAQASPIPQPSSSSSNEIIQELAKRAPAVIIQTCTVANSFAVTFDDGPGLFTNDLLDFLDKIGIKVTFFVNGSNYQELKDPVIAATVKRAFLAGHQIGSHTWSHADLANPSTDIDKEMTMLDNALKEIIGKRPVYMRPPYGNTSPSALAYLGAHGYTVVNWNVDTNDWRHPAAYKVNLQAYKDALQTDTTGKTFISLQHDAEPKTAQSFGKLAIEYVLEKGFKIMPVGTCLGDTTGWYRD
ncbi:chitin deacetylase [Mortierella sp. GBA35]|nr:chitin deacetylase [Mortierella sp. GBA35]